MMRGNPRVQMGGIGGDPQNERKEGSRGERGDKENLAVVEEERVKERREERQLQSVSRFHTR